MLPYAKYGFYKGYDQYLFRLLLGPLQIFRLDEASSLVLVRLFWILIEDRKLREVWPRADKSIVNPQKEFILVKKIASAIQN